MISTKDSSHIIVHINDIDKKKRMKLTDKQGKLHKLPVFKVLDLRIKVISSMRIL